MKLRCRSDYTSLSLPNNYKFWIFWTLWATIGLILYNLHLEIAIMAAIKDEKLELQRNEASIMETFETTAADTEPEYLKEIRHLTNCTTIPSDFKIEYRGNFLVLKNYIRGTQEAVNCYETITYTTHGDLTFLDNLPFLLPRWEAPVSFALYTPGNDYLRSLLSVLHLRNCIEQSALIKKFVTFHFFFDLEHTPNPVILNFTAFESFYQCQLDPPYLTLKASQTYKSNHSLPYFINTARNIAINAAVTHFIFASDVELWPNPGIIESFLKMYAKLGHTPDQKEVFVLPVFEIEKNASVPIGKNDLQEMLKNKIAIKFHQDLYRRGHEVPKEEEWIQTPEEPEMKIFATTKRTGKFEVWEPFYISSRHIPEFDERLTWELRGNKLIHAYVLCLLDYDFHVLNNAFLVHRPGIKGWRENLRGRRSKEGDQLIENSVKPQLLSLYGDREGCKVKIRIK